MVGLPKDVVERWSGATLVLGVLLILITPAFTDIGYDGNAYVATGHGWARTGHLEMAWGDVLTFEVADPGPSHHFPPAYPFYLGLVFKAFGYGLVQAKAAGIFATLVMLATVFLTTRDLYGRRKALVVTSLMSVMPPVLWVSGMGFSENLALTFFTLTMWGILKSLKDERYIVLAGTAAGLAYLTRSGMGAFFLIAGLGGLGWRLLHRGFRKTFASPWYLLAIAIFGSILLAWAWRNVSLFGWPNWETSVGTRYLPTQIKEHPGLMAAGFAIKTPVVLLSLVPPMALLWPEVKTSLRKIRDEYTSGLWLSVFLVSVLGILFAAYYWSFGGGRYDAMRLDNIRYGMLGVVPVLWAAVREADLDARNVRRRFEILTVVLLVGCTAVMAFPAHSLGAEAGHAIDPYLKDGDTIEFGGTGKYAAYATLSHPETLRTWAHGHTPDQGARWIIATWDMQSTGSIDIERYTMLTSKDEPHPVWPFNPDHIEVWVRNDILEKRQVVLGPLKPGW